MPRTRHFPKHVSVRVTDRLNEQIEEQAARRGLSPSKLIRIVVQDWMYWQEAQHDRSA